MPLPNFLIIGSQKSGTTSLYHVLRHHPQIFMPERKEINYFFHQAEYDKGFKHYISHFDHAPENSVAIGEASPGYICHPLSPGRIHRLLPPQAPFAPGKRPLAEIGQVEGRELADLRKVADPDHWLSQPVLVVQILDCVGLVDDIDQMHGLGLAPEHRVDADREGPVALDQVQLGLAQVEMGTSVVDQVQSRERGDAQRKIAAPPLRLEGQLAGDARVVALLRRELRILGEDGPLELDLAEDLDLRAALVGVGARWFF